MNFLKKINPFENKKNKFIEQNTTEEIVTVPVSEQEFYHHISILQLEKNQLLTTIGKEEFLNGIKSKIKNGELIQDEVWKEFKTLSNREFYEKYK